MSACYKCNKCKFNRHIIINILNKIITEHLIDKSNE